MHPITRLVLTAAVATAAAGAIAPLPALAASGKLAHPVAYVRSGIVYVNDGTAEKRVSKDAGNARPRWSPDRRSIAYLHAGSVWVMKANGSGARQVAAGPAGAPSWSPDGRSLAYAAPSCTGGAGVFRVPVTGGAAVAVFPASCRGTAPGTASGAPAAGPDLASRLRVDSAVAWSPNGAKIAFRGGECESVFDDCLSVGDLATGAERVVAAFGGGPEVRSGFAVVPAWRTDSARLSWTGASDTSALGVTEAAADGSGARTVGVAQDREMAYLGGSTGVLTAQRKGGSWVTLVNLRSGARRYLSQGSQPDAGR